MRILISGATGNIGKALCVALQAKNYEISILSRKNSNIAGVKTFLWDVYQQQIDENCLENVDAIIHLAGEGIADKHWTPERKQQLIDSRVQSSQLLYQLLKNKNHQVKTFISASAIGYYGDGGNQILTENSPAGRGFMAECCVKWEQTAAKIQALGLRTVTLRTGIVLGKNMGMLQKMETPTRFCLGAPLGDGQQYLPWIHIDDVVNSYIFALENFTMEGIFNQTSNHPVSNITFTKSLGKALHRTTLPFHVPAWALRLMMGEAAVMATMSSRVSSEKLIQKGYIFKYPNLQDTLNQLYEK